MDFRKARLTLVGLIGLFALPITTLAQDDRDPEKVAARCIERVNQIAENARKAVREVAGRGVKRINELQEQGDQEGAQQAARRAAAAIGHLVDRTTGAVRGHIEHCVRVLKRLEASERLIERVLNAGRSANESIREAGRAGRDALQKALED